MANEFGVKDIITPLAIGTVFVVGLGFLGNFMTGGSIFPVGGIKKRKNMTPWQRENYRYQHVSITRAPQRPPARPGGGAPGDRSYSPGSGRREE